MKMGSIRLRDSFHASLIFVSWPFVQLSWVITLKKIVFQKNVFSNTTFLILRFSPHFNLNKNSGYILNFYGISSIKKYISDF